MSAIRSGSDAHLRETRTMTQLAVATLLFTACYGHAPTKPAGRHAAVDAQQSDLVPRVPSHDPNVYLYARVTHLAFGTSLSIIANGVVRPTVTRDGVWPLLRDVPIGTLYDVAIPTQPRGEDCNITPLHGAVGPHTPYVQVNCKLSVVTANDVNDTVEVGQIDDAHADIAIPPTADALFSPWGKVYTSVDNITFVADRGNQRVLGYYPGPLSNASAIMVLGQNNDFSANTPSGNTVGFTGPSAVGGGNALLLVADTNNHRVVIYEPTPYGQVTPTSVLGQTNLGTALAGCGPGALNLPSQAATSGNMLLVTDSGNHRVLVWNSWPTRMGAPADLVLGQPDFVSCLPNQGTGIPFAESMNNPQDVWADPNHVAVADYGNQRVLIWTELPLLLGQPADLVVGQADLNSSGQQTTSATSLNGPMSVVFDDNTLFVADAQDHRVVAYTPFPTSDGAAASYALGQHLATDNTCNQGNTVAAYTLCQPTGVSFVGGDLAVTDSNNHRVLIFYSDPNAVGQGSFGVVVAPGSHFFAPRLSYDAKAGDPAIATVTALTYQGQTNTGYVGTVAFTSTDPNALLPSPYTCTTTDSGVHDFNVTFFKAQTHALGVYDTHAPATRGTDPNVVGVANDANFIVTSNFPSDPNAGDVGTVTVTAYDAWNNVATGFTGTIHVSSSDPNAILPSDYTFQPADQGTHQFQATLVTPGNQNITVSANGLPVLAGTQQNIIVAALNAVSFDVNNFTSPTIAGVSHTFIVRAIDVQGGTASRYQGTVDFTSDDPNAVLPTPYTFVLADQGVHVLDRLK